MTDINLKLIKLIEEGKTINEITTELNMTNKQILRRLNDIKMDGINYLRNYHYNGDITFNLNKSFGLSLRFSSLQIFLAFKYR